jgi:hypothetical protein
VVCERACGTSLNKHRKEGIYGGGWQIYVWSYDDCEANATIKLPI